MYIKRLLFILNRPLKSSLVDRRLFGSFQDSLDSTGGKSTMMLIVRLTKYYGLLATTSPSMFTLNLRAMIRMIMASHEKNL